MVGSTAVNTEDKLELHCKEGFDQQHPWGRLSSQKITITIPLVVRMIGSTPIETPSALKPASNLIGSRNLPTALRQLAQETLAETT
jgi:hypothetical protein